MNRSTPPPPDAASPETPANEPRQCRRCGESVAAERHQADEGVTWLWRCACGWASARTESGVVSRKRAREAIARALERLESSDDA